MFELLIRGDRVVTPHGVGPWEIAVKDGVIAALGARGTFADAQAARVIDAGDGIVMPGGIDPHVHCAWYMPAFRPGEPSGLSGPPEQVSRAALWGGTTTLIDFAACKPDREGDESSSQGVRDAIEARDRDWVGRCYCDYAYHVMLRGRVPPSTIAELAEAVQAGYPTVKIFTTDITPSRRGRMIRFGELWEIFKVLARAGGLGVIHAEDDDIVMYLYEKLGRGRGGPASRTWPRSTTRSRKTFDPGAHRRDARGRRELGQRHCAWSERSQRSPGRG